MTLFELMRQAFQYVAERGQLPFKPVLMLEDDEAMIPTGRERLAKSQRLSAGRTITRVEEMASMKRPRLRAVQARPGAILELTFISGQHFTLDMSKDLKTYPGLEPLTNGNAFEGAALGDGGWTVEWPELDIQIGADTLFLDALAQAAPDGNTRIFIR